MSNREMNRMMKNAWLTLVALVLIGAATFAVSAEGRSGGLQVGFKQLDITPPAGSRLTGPNGGAVKGTDDPLYVRTMVVRNGDRTLAIVSLDLVKIRRDLADAAIAEACKRTGIDREAVMLCPTHNHSSPLVPMGGPHNKDYLAGLPEVIADSIEQAHKALQPARMLLGRSLVYHVQHRRVISKSDGLAMNTWLKKLNDVKAVPQVLGTAGPIDPELWVARFDSLDGKVLGTLVNFACHPHIHDRRLLKWSADYPGLMAEELANEYGGGLVSVFTQGCSGNINPNWTLDSKWREKAAVFSRAAVDAAMRATPVEGPVAVAYARRDVEVLRSDPAKTRDRAITRLGWRPEAFEGAKKTLAAMPKTRSVPVNAARIGPLGIASNAGELFVEWGIDIKRRSPFPHTIVSELTNDWIGYEPTAQGFQHGGYESLAGVNFVSLEGIQKLVDTAVELLEELWKEGN